MTELRKNILLCMSNVIFFITNQVTNMRCDYYLVSIFLAQMHSLAL